MVDAWDQFPDATSLGAGQDQDPWARFATPGGDRREAQNQPPPSSPSSRDDGGWLSNAWSGVKSAFTGEGHTEFPDRPEFQSAYGEMARAAGENLDYAMNPLSERQAGYKAITRSQITPDEQAQFDILKKAIPGLESMPDKYGNLMLRAPGMSDFAYLNRPGLSRRDLQEFAMQTITTGPLLGWAGGGKTILGKMARGATGLTGASVTQDVIAGQEGSEQGIDPERAAVSGAIGAAIPAAIGTAKGIGGFVGEKARQLRTTAQNIRDPQGAAQREVQAAFQRDFENGGLANRSRTAQPSDQPLAQQYQQDLRVMDFGGENVKREGKKAANFSPSAQESIMRVISDRYETQVPRAENLFTRIFNLNTNSEAARRALQDQARNARAPLYNQAFQQGRNGVDTPVLTQLQTSPIFRRAMKRAESTLQDQAATPGWRSTGVYGPNGKFTLEYWDQVKRNLDDYAGQAFRTGRNSQGAQLSQMARTLRQELDGQVPLYRQARGTAQEFFNADDALEAGQNFAKGDFNFDEAAQAIGRFNPQERNLFEEGFMDYFMRSVRKIPDRSNMLNRIAQSPTERERLRIALGNQRYQQIDSFLRLENIMQSMKEAMGNSFTAKNVSDMMKGYGGVNLGFNLATLTNPVTAIMGAILAGGKAAQLRINEKVAEEVATLLASKDPALFLQGLKLVGQKPLSQAIQTFDDMISRLTPVAVQTGVNQNFYDQATP